MKVKPGKFAKRQFKKQKAKANPALPSPRVAVLPKPGYMLTSTGLLTAKRHGPYMSIYN